MKRHDGSHAPAARGFFDDPTHYLRRNAVIDLRRSLVREALRDASPRRIIDVGCGDGSLSMQYLDAGAELVLVDFSQSMLNAALATVPGFHAKQVTSRQLDVAGPELLELAPADVVLCVGLLAHMRDPEATVTRLAALVEPNGRLLVQVTDYDTLTGKAVYWLSRAAGRGRRYRLSPTSAASIVRAAEAGGLSLSGITAYPASFPGYRSLPLGLQTRMLSAMQSWKVMQPLRTESLLLFRRSTA
jgi:SAM-dependent methyltransferase